MMIEIRPLDTVFFRDGKPFSMGEDTWADCIFPPLPSTIYGAMRSAYIAKRGDLKSFYGSEMEEQIGTPGKNGNFRIKGIYLKRGCDLLFPMPLDLVKDKDLKGEKDKNKVFKMNLDAANTAGELFFTNIGLPAFLFPENIEHAGASEKTFISNSSFTCYLNSSGGIFSSTPQEEITKVEPKVGIKRANNTHTAEEGHLYRVGMNRLVHINPDKTIDEVSFLIDYVGLDDFPERCILKIGGEGKSAMGERVNDFKIPELSPTIKDRINEDRRFKLYFATPAIFKNGWLPDGINRDTLHWGKDGLKLQLLSAAVGKPVSLGGWDMDKNQPKSMRKAIPAGSVYYFEILEGNMEEVLKQFHYNNISDFSPEEGFGLTFAGAIL